MGSRGERIAGLLGLGSVFLEVFYCGGSFYGCAVYRELVLLYDIYLALMCARYMLALTSATRVCSHVCRAVCHLPAVSCFRPPGVGVCGHAVRVAFLLSHGPHAHFRVLKFLTRPTLLKFMKRSDCSIELIIYLETRETAPYLFRRRRLSFPLEITLRAILQRNNPSGHIAVLKSLSL
jgi:hypothetical protein